MGNTPPYAICVIGLGYVGLPLAQLFIEKGHTVLGVDRDASKISSLQQGKSYLTDFSDEQIEKCFADERFEVCSTYEKIRNVDAILICVPTPLDHQQQPDLTYVVQAVQSALPYLKRGQLIVLESSTYPGTVEEVIQPLIESRGFIIGQDIALAYSPERIDPGSGWSLEEIPKVVGGITPSCTRFAEQVYASAFRQIKVVSTARTAELVKLIENCQRYVNISFINSLLPICEKLEINLWEAIQAAATKPYGFTPYYPGPGVGGHCIPVDPLYLQWKAKQLDEELPFIQLSHEINKQMPAYIVNKVKRALHVDSLQGKKLFIIGVTYKKDVNDMRESTAISIMEKLHDEGAQLIYHDPYIPSLKTKTLYLKSTAITDDILQQSDCILILTDHSHLPYSQIVNHAKLVIDTRQATGSLSSASHVILI